MNVTATQDSGVYKFGPDTLLKSKIQAMMKWDSDKQSLKVEDGKIILGDGRTLPGYIIRGLGLKEHCELKTFCKYYSYTVNS